ncbi:MAG TPA: DUF2520 domain-containing protein [Kofleriaceae bacterium]|nr:DUF2520 domain-containing protein [Kofleriaceae bacterium]
MTARTPNTFIVGGGPVATALAGALRLGGVPVLGLWVRRPEAARAAARDSGVAAFSAAPPDLLLEADVVVVAVNDDAIPEVASTLVQTGLITRRHVMLHCAGGLAAKDAFAGISKAVGGIGTLHPLRAIADGRRAMRQLRDTVFGIEGDDSGRAMARALVGCIGGSAIELSGEEMVAYHAAAAVASNYLVVLMDVAQEILAAAGVEGEAGLAALLALAEGTLDNVRERGVAGGLTGPVRRGDADTVARHVARLTALSPEVAEIYRLLGRRAVTLTGRIESGEVVDKKRLAAVMDALADFPGSATLDSARAGR